MSADRADHLISLIAQGDATEGDWAEFQRLGNIDSDLWPRLALAQRDQAELVRAMGTAVAIADEVPLPGGPDARPAGPAASAILPRRFALPRLSFGALTWGGWAVAAAVALVAFPVLRGPFARPDPVAAPRQQDRVTVPDLTVDAAWQRYIDKGREEGRVLGEMPASILVGAREIPGAGYEVLYWRPVLERRHVPGLYRANGVDERGQPIFVQYESRPAGAR